MKRMRCWVAGYACCLALASCGDGQAGSNYRGEPLMSMKGVITSSAMKLDQSLVPALVLRESPYKSPFDGPDTVHFVLGEVEGTFPSAFTLLLYEPPPAVTVHEVLDGEPAFAVAELIATSPEHPAWLRYTQSEVPIEGGAVQRDEVCSPTECISGTYEHCRFDGQPHPEDPWPCGNAFPNNLPWASYGSARDHMVLYVAGPVAAGSALSSLLAGGGALSAGYHVIERGPAPQDDPECFTRARERAARELSRLTGTPWTVQDVGEVKGDPMLVYKADVSAIAAEGCQTGLNVVRDTNAHPVKLDMVDQQTRVSVAF